MLSGSLHDNLTQSLTARVLVPGDLQRLGLRLSRTVTQLGHSPETVNQYNTPSCGVLPTNLDALSEQINEATCIQCEEQNSPPPKALGST